MAEGCLSERKVYWPNRAIGVVLLFTGIFFVTWWLGLLIVGLQDILGGRDVHLGDLLTILALVVAVLFSSYVPLGGFDTLMVRVVINDRGLAKSYWPVPLAGFSFSWEDLESWRVREEPGEPYYCRHAWFKVRGRRWSAVISVLQVWRPGFDQFLEEVRAHVGTKEQAANHPGDDGSMKIRG